jgi:hypothetical protein
MAFGGNAGAAAGLLAVGTYIPNPGSDGAAYDGDEMEYTEGGAHAYGAPDLLRNVTLLITTPLAAYADATIDGSAADTGVLTTAAAAADQHGLPSNFGPGRGNWTLQDIARLSVDVRTTEAAPAASQPTVAVLSLTVSSGDLVIVCKNQSTGAPEAITVKLRYDHSMVF